jgi:hypothetical protein
MPSAPPAMHGDGLVFNIGVLSENVSRGDSLYQADRLKGNIKLFRESPPLLVTTRRAFKILMAREHNALLCEAENAHKTSEEVKQESKKLAKDIDLPEDVYRYNIHLTAKDFEEVMGCEVRDFVGQGGYDNSSNLLGCLGLEAPAKETGWRGVQWAGQDENDYYMSSFTGSPHVYTVSEGLKKIRGIGGSSLFPQGQVDIVSDPGVKSNTAVLRSYPVYQDDSDRTKLDIILCLLTKSEQPQLHEFVV